MNHFYSGLTLRCMYHAKTRVNFASSERDDQTLAASIYIHQE
jgi:hypothetical protein